MTFPDIVSKICRYCNGTGKQRERQYRCEDCDGAGRVTVCGHCDEYLQDCKCQCTSCCEKFEECQCEMGVDE